jgi:hypothetical protein
MSAPAFTPGPWRVDGDDEGCDGVPYIEIATGESSTYHVIAHVQPTFKQGQTLSDDDWSLEASDEANAHLIAAAPELYDALEKALAALDADVEGAPLDNREGRLAQAWLRGIFGESARAALRKARGEA